MAIFNARVEANFTTLPNEAIRDPRLSFEATGLLTLMLSLPDDWEIHKSWLEKQKIGCGRDKLTRIMNELIDCGYVVRKARQDEKGKMNGVDWFVYSTDQLKNRITENPSDGKPVTTKEIDIQKKELNKDIAQSDLVGEAFGHFWSNMKLVKKSKKSALAAFKKLTKDKSKTPMEWATLLINDIQNRINANQFGIDKLHPSTYLNGQRWEDEITINHQMSAPQNTQANQAGNGQWLDEMIQDGELDKYFNEGRL